MPVRQTHTYATLEVSQATFDDVTARLRKVVRDTDDSSYWWTYTDCSGLGQTPRILTLGAIALVVEARPPFSWRKLLLGLAGFRR